MTEGEGGTDEWGGDDEDGGEEERSVDDPGDGAGAEDGTGAEGDAGAERDPFGRLEDAAADRDGDPFEALGDPDVEDGVGASVGDDAPAAERSPGEATSEADAGVSTAGADLDEATPGTPDVEADPESRTGDPFESPESAFQQIDVGEVDEDAVWQALSEAEARGSVADVGERTYAEVSKHRFCETCEHFTGPPEVACTNEGTEILEFLDMETVRVVDCPIVEERRALERGDDPSA